MGDEKRFSGLHDAVLAVVERVSFACFIEIEKQRIGRGEDPKVRFADGYSRAIFRSEKRFVRIFPLPREPLRTPSSPVFSECLLLPVCGKPPGEGLDPSFGLL